MSVTPSPDLEYDAGEFVSRDMRQLRLELILAGDNERVGEIDRARFHTNADLTRSRPTRFDILDRENVGSAPLMATNRFHLWSIFRI